MRARPNVRRLVFWITLGTMLAGALSGLVWALLDHDFGPGPLACLAVGLTALLVALVFGLLTGSNLTDHHETPFLSWSDVDELRALAQRPDVGVQTSEWARSLANRIALTLPAAPDRPPQRVRPIRLSDRARIEDSLHSASPDETGRQRGLLH